MDQVFTYESFVHATAGSIGGQAAMSAFYPFETIRTQIQANEHLKSKTTLEVVKILVEEDGVGSLYKGIRPVLISLLASNFIYFYTNNMFKVIYKKRTGKGIGVLPNLLIAFAAGVVNVVTTCPFIILVTNPMINYTVFDQTKKYFLRWMKQKNLTPTQSFLLGLLAKFVATILTYPLQVAQTKLRTSKKTMTEEETKKTGIKKYENTLDCLIKMFQEEGIYGWYRGVGNKLVQTLLMSAFHLTIYDKIVTEVEKVMGGKVKSHH
ncbi:hypothetical protein C9374_003037 [Naegleria lovaniensis]|uniref:Mitochondrial carrier protein n=1 Tax=Naegleria lovaniensis TaxID=51637 RepID=A0AA88GTS9_NAELO|nr:uncharacterized protein C9374_003037 [Naegleria lovaniensis]KAG2385888.1 hypothetical protein C9374_003037 [Naegleria lovaniensis]